MELSSQIYSAAQVSDAAQVKLPTLQGWLRRYDKATQNEHSTDGGGKRGVTRRFSYYNAMHFAISQALISEGMEVALALDAGATFAHSGAKVKDIQRQPGVPFADPNGTVETLVCVSNEKGTAVVPGYDGFDWYREANMLLGLKPFDGPRGIFVLPVRGYWIETCHRLGLRPNDVLKSAYHEG